MTKIIHAYKHGHNYKYKYKIVKFTVLRCSTMASLTSYQLLSAFEYPGNKQEAIRLLSAFSDQSEIKNIKNSNSWYLIHCAAGRGWTELVELLVTTYHCNPNCTDRLGWTSLHWACFYKHLPTVKLLTTQYCLDPLKTDNRGNTPLYYSRGETTRYLEQIIGKCVCLYVYCLYICTLLKYSKQQITLFTTLKCNK